MRSTRTIQAGLVAGLLLAPLAMAHGQEGRLSEQYGFLPLEIYKLDARISNLAIGDLNADKVDDIVVANNARSRIDLLLSQPPGAAKPATPERRPGEPNELPSDRRFKLQSIPVNREVVTLQLGDFNHDGRLDLAFYGTPAEIQVLENQGEAKFGEPRTISTGGDAVESPSALAVGDLNGDNRDDLVLLAPNELLAITQGDRGLGTPERWPHAAGSPNLLRLVDLDGDGQQDLVIAGTESETPVRIRLRETGGRFGPEERFALELPRALAFANLDAAKGDEMLAIEDRSGRVQVLKLEPGGARAGAGSEPSARGRVFVFPLGSRDTRGRAIALGDLDGDGRTDIVATDPSRAQTLVFLQDDRGIRAALPFPSLSGSRGVQAADIDGDKRAEVVVLSRAEKQIGLAAFKDGRLPFPTPLPTVGEPLAMAVTDLDANGPPEIVYATAEPPGQTATLFLRALKRGPDGTFTPFKWGNDDKLPLNGLASPPASILPAQLNADDAVDLLLFPEFGPPSVLVARKDLPPTLVGASGPLADATAASVTLPPPPLKGLVVAQGNFARRVELVEGGRWEVREQFNAGQNAAQVQAAAMLPGSPGRVALLDRTTRALLWLDQRDGGWTADGNVPVGPIDFQGLRTADLDGDGQPDLVIAGSDAFAVVLNGRSGSRFRPLASHVTDRRDAHYADLAAADLNGDGRLDLLLTDTGKQFVEILATSGNPLASLTSALAFPVFETKSFRTRDRLVEPREFAVGDLNGDRLTDFALLVHDRVLVYLQDPGPQPAPTASATAPAGAPGGR